jgi:hypothetical protein
MIDEESPPITKLFLTFIKKEELDNVVEELKRDYTILFNNIFVFNNSEDLSEYILSYTIEHHNVNKLLPYTINVNRKRKNKQGEQLNVIYTLNGLNMLKEHNQSEIIDWIKYKNCIIIVSPDKELRLIKTSLVKKIEIIN